MTKKMSISFYLKADKKRADGNAPIYIKITCLNGVVSFATGKYILPSRWTTTKQLKVTRKEDDQKLQIELGHIRKKLFNIQEQFSGEGKITTAPQGKEAYLNPNIIKQKNSHTLTEFWQRKGLDGHEGLSDQSELRAKDKILKSFSDDFAQLENPSYLASFFKSSASNYLEFYNKANPKLRKYVIDLSRFEEVEISKQEITHKAFSVNRYKSMLRNLFAEYILTGEEQYFHTLANITSRYKLTNWICNSVPRWIREFRLNT